MISMVKGGGSKTATDMDIRELGRLQQSQRHTTRLESMFVLLEGGVDGEFESNTRSTLVNNM
jgi:hypothetical protein